ncbi:MAG: hypothetical protein ETSY1_02515 [Candidatus Entotheonella factor]|uniref:NAD-dependent epimerase/dehydratase domain-containing protein n=1 Tax=Entotheonella factor TaxID=1429438 RepID=W4LXU7_ENTF1|nr:MAG: hypothetical protein ETSY1_02515 [Candidatus Entotheonella factor]
MIHTASLHAPHVGAYSEQAFYETNVHGTETLLNACLQHGVKRFVYTSTTSLYGNAMIPKDRAVWVTEDLPPIPRDIYDETKIAAEHACQAAAANAGLTGVSLRISRCFPEPAPLMAIYRLYRGVDLRDVANAHRLALSMPLSGFETLNISAAPPFAPEDTEALLANAAQVITRYYPWAPEVFRRRGWVLPHTIDRIYVIDKAQRMLGYRPEHNFDTVLYPRDR